MSKDIRLEQLLEVGKELKEDFPRTYEQMITGRYFPVKLKVNEKGGAQYYVHMIDFERNSNNLTKSQYYNKCEEIGNTFLKNYNLWFREGGEC